MGGWPSLKTERRRQKWTSDLESGIIYCFWLCICLKQKNIYFLRMGGWPSIKTERQRQKLTSDMESGIIYCFWLCSCLCHKRIWMDYLFQIHIFHPGSTTIQ